MADININGQFEDMVNFTADFGTVQNSFPPVDPDVTPDSTNPVASKGIYEFVKDIEEDVDIRIDGVSDSLNREVNNRNAADELLQTQISAEESARISADNLLRQAYNNNHERIVNLSLNKQDNLVSGQNIKTVNGQSLVGEGDIHIEGGSGDVKDVLVDEISVLGSDKIARIPKASSDNSGTIKIGNGAQVNSAGTIRATALTKENYDAANGNTFVGKTTLENVLSPIREDISGLDDKIKDLELFKFPNVTIIGTPTINNGQISGFSATSYLKFPFLVDFRSQPFEINMAFTTGSNVVNQENIFDSDFGLAFAVRNSRFVIAISTNGTSWDLGEGVGILTVQPNTTYYIKIAWNGSHYILYYSLDGTTYTADITKTSTSQPYPKQIYIGVGENFASVVNHFSGTINLNNANVKVNGEIFWTGMDDAGISTRADVSLSNIDADGEEKIKEVAETEAIKTDLTSVKADLTKLVSTEPQTLTDSQKAQARANIGVGGSGTVDEVARQQIADVEAELDLRINKVGGGESPNLFDKNAIGVGKLNGDWGNWGFTSYDHSDYIKQRVTGKVYFNQLPADIFYFLDGVRVGAYTTFTDEGNGWYSSSVGSTNHDGFSVDFRHSSTQTPYVDINTFMIAFEVLDHYIPYGSTDSEIHSFGERLAKYSDLPIVEIPPDYIQGDSNFFIGKNSGINTIESTSGEDGKWNCAIGTRAMQDNVSGDHCTAIGFQALMKNTTGDGNTALGEDTLYENTTGSSNVSIGSHNMQNSTTGSGNTSVGSSAMMNSTTGFYNVAIGLESGYHGTPITTDDRCTFVGMRTGKSVSTNVSNATAIGYGAKATKSNQVVIGNSSVVEVIMGNKKLNFNDDGSVTWETI